MDRKGAFANDKEIEADLTFTPDLDGQWLVVRHTDRHPNRYKALALWGIESTSGELVMAVSDNFKGARLFTSQGWRDGKVVFVKHSPALSDSSAPSRRERFTYERQSSSTFKMTYEASGDGVTWCLGDSLVFSKTQ